MIYRFDLQAVRHGGKKEYDAVVEVHDKPKSPTAKLAAMYVCRNLLYRSQNSQLLQVSNGLSRRSNALERDVAVYP